MALQRCTECYGRKRMIGLGGMSQICPTCNGEGHMEVDANAIANTPAIQPNSLNYQTSPYMQANTEHVAAVPPTVRAFAPLEVPASHIVKADNTQEGGVPPIFKSPQTQLPHRETHIIDQQQRANETEHVPPLFRQKQQEPIFAQPIRAANPTGMEGNKFVGVRTTEIPSTMPPVGFVAPTETAIPRIDTFDKNGNKIQQIVSEINSVVEVLAEPTPVNIVSADSSGKGVPVLTRRGRPKKPMA